MFGLPGRYCPHPDASTAPEAMGRGLDRPIFVGVAGILEGAFKG
jgi:hypothetical protein